MLPDTRFLSSLLVCAVAIVPVGVAGAGARLTSSASDRADSWFSERGQAPQLSRFGSSADCDGVLSVERRFVDDMKAKNMDDILSLYAPGAVFIQPDSTEVVGENALRKLYRTVFATYDSDLSFEDSDVHSVSPGSALCVHSGYYDEKLRTRKDGAVARVRGMFSFTYKRKKDGHWLITRMRWSSAAE